MHACCALHSVLHYAMYHCICPFSQINFVMISSINYNQLTNRTLFKQPTKTKTIVVEQTTVVDDRNDSAVNAGRRSHHASRSSLHSLSSPRRAHHSSVHSLDGLRHDIHRRPREPSEPSSLPPPYNQARYRPNGYDRHSEPDTRHNIRSSKDIELEYMDSMSSAPRRRDDDSNMGVRYYYRWSFPSYKIKHATFTIDVH